MLLGSRIAPFSKPTAIVVADHYHAAAHLVEGDALTTLGRVEAPKELRTDRPGVRIRRGRGQFMASGSSPAYGTAGDKLHQLEHLGHAISKLLLSHRAQFSTIHLLAPKESLDLLALHLDPKLRKLLGKKIGGTYVKLHPKKLVALVRAASH